MVAGGPARDTLNGMDIVAVPLKIDDTIRVGMVRRQGVTLSRAGTVFADALRDRCARYR